MPLIIQNEVPQIIAELDARGGRLIHACQLQDLESYVALGGVPSRALIEQAEMPFTSFVTDEIDHTNQIWDKVFFNLSDFSDWFAQGKNSLPNPYGPVALIFNPAVLSQATDLSITLRSASAAGFNREVEGIESGDFSKMFADVDGLAKRHIKFKPALEIIFPGRVVSTPEMNCNYQNQLASLEFLRCAIVDNYPSLANSVRNIFSGHKIQKKVFERFANDARKLTYQALWSAIADGCDDIQKVLARNNLDASTRAWCQNVANSNNLSFQFKRFARYLRNGTIDWM